MIADELALLPSLRRAGGPAVTRASRHFLLRELHRGELVWAPDAPVDGLAILLAGELEAVVAGQPVGRVRAPELVGEATAFFAGSERTATVRAAGPARLAVLPARGLEALRRERSPVYDVLLDDALATLLRRIRDTDARLAQAVRGDTPAPVRREASALVRMWRSVVPGLPGGTPPPVAALLRGLPGLADAPEELLGPLAAAWTPTALPAGEIVFLEGEPGAAAFLVATGKVEVLRHVRGDRAELLATLGPGAPFGANALLSASPRTASCVTAAPSWLYTLVRPVLGGLPAPVRRRFRETLLATFAAQIRGANLALRKALPHAGPPRPEALLEAAGRLEGLSLEDAELESVSFVVDEDMRRNPRNRR